MQNRLLLFDIDGTLIRMKRGRSHEILRSVFKEIFSRDLPDDAIGDLGGKTDVQIFHEICKFIGIPEEKFFLYEEKYRHSLERIFSKYADAEHIEILPGVEKLLGELSGQEGIQLALLTGNLEPCAYDKLRPHSLDKFFPFGAFGSDHHARNFLPPIAIGRANDFAGKEIFSSENTVIIGDTPRDIECAKAHGIATLAVATGKISSDELKKFSPELVMENFSDTEQALNAILNKIWK